VLHLVFEVAFGMATVALIIFALALIFFDSGDAGPQPRVIFRVAPAS
jgi:hypothetical protein